MISAISVWPGCSTRSATSAFSFSVGAVTQAERAEQKVLPEGIIKQLIDVLRLVLLGCAHGDDHHVNS
jgi:hypothetical protein